MPAQTERPLGTADRTPLVEVTALVVLLCVAAGLRLYNLGALGLQVDEGVHALAVQGWLRDGLPILPSGAVYQRSIPFLALQAITARLTGVNELALRLPAALFGVAGVAATYGLARVMFDRRVAMIAATFIALSAWEIELSRYGRFYTAFQVSFVLAFLCFYRLTNGGTRVWMFGFVAATLAAITLHELSIVIAILLLIPLFDRDASWKMRVKSIAGSVAVIGVWLLYRRQAGSWLVSMAPDHGLEILTASEPLGSAARILPFLPAIPLPDMTLVTAALTTPASGLYAVLLLCGVCVWLTIRRTSIREAILLGIAAVLGAIHLFMMSFLVLLAWFVLFGTSWNDLWAPRVRPVLLSIGVSLVFWTLVAWTAVEGMRGLLLELFGFPRVLQYFVYWLALGWPMLLLAATIAGIVQLVRYFRTHDRALLYLPAGIVLPVVAASLFAAYGESRYIFHVYPLLVVSVSWGCVLVADRIGGRSAVVRHGAAVLAAVAAVAMLATGDVGAKTIAPVTRTYGEARDVMRSVISWPVYGQFHQDQAGAAAYVRAHREPGDRVVAIGLQHQLNIYRFYGGQLDAALARPEDAFYQRRLNGRLVDWVTGAELFTTVPQLVQDDGTTWLIGDTAIVSDSVTYFPPHVRESSRRLAAGAVFWGRDRKTYVVRLP